MAKNGNYSPEDYLWTISYSVLIVLFLSRESKWFGQIAIERCCIVPASLFILKHGHNYWKKFLAADSQILK